MQPAVDMVAHPRSESPSAAFMRGTGLLRRGDAVGAAAALRASALARPGHLPGLLALSEASSLTGRHDDAVRAAMVAVAAHPGHDAAANRLAEALAGMSAAGANAGAWLRADLPAKALMAAGIALGRADDLAAAMDAFALALDREPANGLARVNFGCALFKLGRFAEAAAHLRMAVAAMPDDAVARFGLANALLAQGAWREGWEAYEFRWRLPGAIRPVAPGPAWKGEPLEGRRLLVLAEQGFGDMLQFARFLPLLPAGARLRAPKALHRLLAGVVEMDDGQPGATDCCHCPLMSLPHLLGVSPVDAPAPYLLADPALRARWRGRLPALGSRARRRVGLVWSGGGRRAGGGDMQAGAGRSLDAAALAPLLAVESVRFVSLQHGAPGAAAALGLPDPMPDVTDFADTAALLAELDLLVSVDTAAAHLAGALGVPAWVLLRPDTDWRWPSEGQHSAWYPSLRLFRQPSPGDWAGVIAEVAVRLAAWA